MNWSDRPVFLNHEASRRHLLPILICTGLILLAAVRTIGAAEPARFLRYQKGNTIAYGLLEGNQVRQLAGDLFGHWSKTETRFPLKAVKVLIPTTPTQALAMAGNFTCAAVHATAKKANSINNLTSVEVTSLYLAAAGFFGTNAWFVLSGTTRTLVVSLSGSPFGPS